MKNELELAGVFMKTSTRCLDVVFMITRAPTRLVEGVAAASRRCRSHTGLSEWRESLKEILLYAGIKAQPAVFLFSDTQIVFEAMLEDINNVLNTVESVLKLNLNLSHEIPRRATSRTSTRPRTTRPSRRPASRTACGNGCNRPN